MRAPEFWNAGHTLVPMLLAPLALVYETAAEVRRSLAQPWRAPVPVISVGNLIAGGAGKTPTALALAQCLRNRGGVHILSRGYGGRLAGPVRVDPARHDAGDVGDEPLLLAAEAPTWIGRDRVAAARAAAAAGAEVLVLDDGHQNPALVKDIAVLVVDGGNPVGNGRVIPAGPLREAPARGVARADAIVWIDDPGAVASQPPDALDHKPLLRARLEPGPELAALRDRPVFAFAGIARPAKFFATLRTAGCVLAGAQGFADHHRFPPEELVELMDRAAALGATLVTTAKDAVRLPTSVRAVVEVVTVRLVFTDPAAVERLLAPVTGTR
ncbi:MAG: tetraacyldisaccharide 4'-kinase [Alphaproteobacteria bacterium]|nr:tetraacyldisaccharide 4'-kinase [Alphaproteobacteria bacterium]